MNAKIIHNGNVIKIIKMNVTRTIDVIKNNKEIIDVTESVKKTRNVFEKTSCPK
ncbi:MAG: hypothetical protein HRO68_10125 [Nitrosopumilus sp.]|nr:hypothetical protein [Nitrosopumilus sp.]